MSPVTRSMRVGSDYMLRFCTFDILIHISMFLFFVQDVCTLKQVCRYFGTDIIRHILSNRLRHIGLMCMLRPGPTAIMTHIERAWQGVRLVSLSGSECKIILREDHCRVLGRKMDDDLYNHQLVSRHHALITLASGALEFEKRGFCKVTVLGLNGLVINKRCFPQGAERMLYLNDKIELGSTSRVFYRIDYI